MTKKQSIIAGALAVLFLSIGSSVAFFLFQENKKPIPNPTECPFETKYCSDGSGVSRVGPQCEFALCPSEKMSVGALPTPEISTSTQEITTIPSTSTSPNIPVAKRAQVATQGMPAAQPEIKTPAITANTSFKNPLPAIFTIVSNVVSSLRTEISQVATTIQIPSAPNQTTNTSTTPVPPTEQKYAIQNGAIVSSNNTVIYAFPSSTVGGLSTSTPDGWETHLVNAVPVNTVAPILNAIPIVGLPGKYYLSENSFGNRSACEFSNKIYILDTTTNETVLMYEENNMTLSSTDPRACNSEILLLATEDSKLVLKYHTLGTNNLCDSSWSEPDKTYYLNVTKLPEGMKKYTIPVSLSDTAELEEESCRAKL